jgi:hypothetical protein
VYPYPPLAVKPYLGKAIESVATNAAGRVVFTAVIEGKKTGFVLDPTTERWSKP